MEMFEETFENINKLRFDKLIKYDNPLNQSYGLVEKEYLTRKSEKAYGRSALPTAVCNLCEENLANKSADNEFLLQIVSHGIHSLDLFKIQNFTNYSVYRDDGVMLVMESPSNNLDACYLNNFDGKHPAKVWWWIDGENTNNPKTYPDDFSSKKYGEFFNSFVHTFKLRNAYMTNLIKCGMLKNSDSNTYGNFNKFPGKCINICFENIFLNEVKIVKPKVIFTLSSKVNTYLTEKKSLKRIEKEIGFKPLIVSLPHPARCRQGFSNEYYRTLWYCRTLEGLIKSSIIRDKNEQYKYWDKYVENNNNSNINAN